MSDRQAGLDPRLREVLAVLAHELRSPIGALLGFEELLSEGIYGSVDDQAREGLARMRHSARQMLQLIDGMAELALHQPGSHQPVATLVEPTALLRACAESQEPDATHRGTTLELETDDTLRPLRTDAERAARALQLAIAAAIKSTHAGRIRIAAHQDHGATTFEIHGAGLAAEKDDPERSPRLSGAGLRIAMARTTLHPLRGTLTFAESESGTMLRLRVPSLAD